MTNKMIRLVCHMTLLSFLLTLGLTAKATREWRDPAGISSLARKHPLFAGRYRSKVYSDGKLQPGAVQFRIDATGNISGWFSYKEGGGVVKGRLSGCSYMSVLRKIICTWTDKYGSGMTNLDFSRDFTEFHGVWNAKGSSSTYPWHGRR